MATDFRRAEKILWHYVKNRRISQGHLFMAYTILYHGTADLPHRLLGAYRLAKKFSEA